MLGFTIALEDHLMGDITPAFKQWLKEKEIFPTPAGILKLTENYRAIRLRTIGAKIPKHWSQIIRDKDTDEIIQERPYSEALSGVELASLYPGRNIRTAYSNQ